MTSPDAAPGYARESPLAIVNRRIENRELSERLLKDLTASGYHIIRATPEVVRDGAVTISVPEAKVLREICRRTRNTGDQSAAAYYVKWFDQAIAASGGRHDGE